MFTYQPEGVCSQEIQFKIEEGILKDVNFIRGCPGSLQGIASLVDGMEATEAVRRLRGIPCKKKETSCPDQLALAIEKALAE